MEKLEQLAIDIVNEIDMNLANKFLYIKNLNLGIYSEVEELVNKVKQIASSKNIVLDIEYDPILIWNVNIKIIGRYNNSFMNYLMAERYFYQKIKEENIFTFDFKDNALENLYVLHALQTAFYHAGFDEGFVIINNKRYRIEPKDMSSKYHYNTNSKVIDIKEAKYRKKIKKEHEMNLYKI